MVVAMTGLMLLAINSRLLLGDQTHPGHIQLCDGPGVLETASP